MESGWKGASARGHCCPELCPPYSSNGNEPRTTVLYGNNSASVTTRSPPFFFFCSIPSLYISLPSKLLNVGLHVEAAHLKQAKTHQRERGKQEREHLNGAYTSASHVQRYVHSPYLVHNGRAAAASEPF